MNERKERKKEEKNEWKIAEDELLWLRDMWQLIIARIKHQCAASD